MSLRKILVQYIGTCLRLPELERDVTLITTEDGKRYMEAVTCRDCVYYTQDPYPIDPGWPMMCELHSIEMVSPNCFCAWAERREQ